MLLDLSRRLGQTVGARLRAVRLSKKYTQSQLAHPDFSVSYISAIERGQIQPSLRALEIFARRLGISSAYFLPQQNQEAGGPLAAAEKNARAAEERAWLLIEAQIALYQQQPARAIALLQPLMRVEESREHIAILYVLGRAYLHGGCLQESEATLAEAARLAQIEKDELYPRILHVQGEVCSAMHRLEQAVRFQQASLAALEQDSEQGGDVAFLAQVYSSLGQTCSQLGAFEQARDMFQRVFTLLQPQTPLQPMPPIPSGLSTFYPEEGAPVEIDSSQHKQLQAQLQSQLPALQGEIQYALGRALLQSQPDEASSHLLALSQQVSTPQHALTRAGARVLLAARCFARADFAQAEIWVREALEQAEPFGESLMRADALILRGKLAYVHQNYEQGDQSFTAGLAMLERGRYMEELIEHLTAYARVLEERGLFQQAIMYWKRAYAYRQKEAPATQMY